MASEIHKKRTGKGFRISEEIVRKEEMYEEEDEFPRSYRVLAAHMPTDSTEMNSRVEAYMTGRLAMSAYMSKINENWKENNINQLFAASFPNAAQQAQQISQRMSQPNTYQDVAQGPQRTAQPSLSPNFQSVNYEAGGRHESLSSVSPTDSNPNETPMSPSSGTHASSLTPNTPITTTFSYPSTELPNEMQLMMNGAGGMDLGTFNQHNYDKQDWVPPTNNFYDPKMDYPMKLDEMGGANPYPNSQWEEPVVPTTKAMDYSWDVFINDNA
jgi:hypothetical protein